MALTAFPTLTFNSGTGSDTAASGAGPGTALTGTANASTSGASTTVSLGGSPNLSGVATDGSAVLWLKGFGFYRIDTTNDGADTVVIETAVNISTPCDWAIGGKRASLDDTNSRKLFAATAAGVGADTGTGGASGRWTISLEADDTISSVVTAAFTAGTGYLNIQSDTPGTLRTLTQSGNAKHFACNTANRIQFTDIKFANSNGTKNEVIEGTSSTVIVFRHCVIGDSGGTNCPKGAYLRSGSQSVIYMYDTSVLRCTSVGINGACDVYMFGSEVSRCTGAGISAGAGNLVVDGSIVSFNGGDGINSSATICVVRNSTIHANSGDGIEHTGANNTRAIIISNQCTGNGTGGTGYGANFSGTAPNYPLVEFNNFGNASDSTNNATGSTNGITLSSTNLTTAPAYTDSSNSVRNFAVGTAMKAVGFPASTATIGAGQTSSTSYVDIGAVQRQEASSGGGGPLIGGRLVL